jgi:ribose transport system substrate-binding protein
LRRGAFPHIFNLRRSDFELSNPRDDIMFRIGRILAVTAFAAAFAAVIPACNKSTSSGKPLVAFISNNSFEFWTIAKKGTEAAARESGVDCEFWMPPSGGTAEDQRRIIEDLMVKNVKAIAISPKDAKNQGEFLKDINAKIPLIAVDSDVTDPSARRCYLGTDNIAAGRATGKLLKEALPKGGKFMIFVGKLDVQNAVERRHGLVTELAGGEDKCQAQLQQLKDAKYPVKFGDFELLDTRTDNESQSTCKAKAEDALAQYGDLAAMVGLWAYNPPAMLEAVKGASDKLGKVKLIGFDENDETLQGIRDGQIVGTVVQDPYNFGFEAVKIMAAYAKGSGDAELAARKDINKDKQIYVRHRIINKDGKPGKLTADEKIEAVDPFQAKLKELKK